MYSLHSHHTYKSSSRVSIKYEIPADGVVRVGRLALRRRLLNFVERGIETGTITREVTDDAARSARALRQDGAIPREMTEVAATMALLVGETRSVGFRSIIRKQTVARPVTLHPRSVAHALGFLCRRRCGGRVLFKETFRRTSSSSLASRNRFVVESMTIFACFMDDVDAGDLFGVTDLLFTGVRGLAPLRSMS